MGETRVEKRKSLREMVNEWERGVEGQRGNVQEEWREERRVTCLEDDLLGSATRWRRSVSLAQQQQ